MAIADLTGGWCRNTLDIPIQPLGAVDRRQHRACNVRCLRTSPFGANFPLWYHLTFLLTIIPAVLVGALLPPRRNKHLNEVYSAPR